MTIFDTPPAEGAPPVVGDNAPPADPPSTPPVETPSQGTTPPPEGAELPPVPKYLDIDEYGDHLVKLKVDGEEKELPFKSVRDGLMMQDAFTRRTQELAEERRRLQQADALVAALDADPESTLRSLAEVYDLDAAAGLQPVQRTPEELQLRQARAQLQNQQQQLTRDRINAEVAAVRAKDPNVDLNAVVAITKERGVDLLSAHEIYEARAFKSQQVTEQRRAAAAAASAATHVGGAAAKGAVNPQKREIKTMRDAWLAAKAEHNIT